MENLLNPRTMCTDPDTLQFCLPLSDTEFWYCQANDLNKRVFPGAETVEKIIYDTLCGYPFALFALAKTVSEIKEFISNHCFWYTGNININSITHTEKFKLLSSYGYSWNDFSSDAERSQIICECYFEENIIEFKND